MYLSLHRASAKAKKERAAKRAYLRKLGEDAPSSDEEREKVFDEFGDEVVKVDKYKEASDKLIASLTGKAKPEGLLVKFGKNLKRMSVFGSSPPPTAQTAATAAAQPDPAPQALNQLATAPASSVQPGPPVGQQIPMMGQQQMPMMGQMPVSSLGGPKATIGGAPGEAVTDSGVEMTAPLLQPDTMMLNSQQASMGMAAPLLQPNTMMLNRQQASMGMAAPLLQPSTKMLNSQQASIGMAAPLLQPNTRMLNSQQASMGVIGAPNLQSRQWDQGRDKNVEAKMWNHQAMVTNAT
jgi:hypothetical protein